MNAAPPAQPGLPQPARRRLLVVDDNIDAAQTLALIFELYGQDVRTAYDSLAALRIAAEWQPQAAVLDIALPGTDGYQLCRRIRESARGPQPLLIALSGTGGAAYRERARVEGFDAALDKPVEPDVLLRLLVDHPPRG